MKIYRCLYRRALCIIFAGLMVSACSKIDKSTAEALIQEKLTGQDPRFDVVLGSIDTSLEAYREKDPLAFELRDLGYVQITSSTPNKVFIELTEKGKVAAKEWIKATPIKGGQENSETWYMPLSNSKLIRIEKIETEWTDKAVITFVYQEKPTTVSLSMRRIDESNVANISDLIKERRAIAKMRYFGEGQWIVSELVDIPLSK